MKSILLFFLFLCMATFSIPASANTIQPASKTSVSMPKTSAAPRPKDERVFSKLGKYAIAMAAISVLAIVPLMFVFAIFAYIGILFWLISLFLLGLATLALSILAWIKFDPSVNKGKGWIIASTSIGVIFTLPLAALILAILLG